MKPFEKLFNKLFGDARNDKKEDAEHPSPQPVKRECPSFEDDSSFIDIPSIDFFGQYTKSNSGEWAICWQDDSIENDQNIDGRYVLYNRRDNTIAMQGRLERPNNGHVANNGDFSLEDWHYGFGNELSGTLYVFSSKGKILIQKRYHANIGNSAISESGRYAICQTSQNPDSEDGNRLTVFDTEKNTQLFSIHPPAMEWADNFAFREDIQQFGIVMNKIGTFYFDREGNFLDTEGYRFAMLKSDNFYTILSAAGEMLKSTDFNKKTAEAVIDAVTRARANGKNKSDYQNALALKIQGQAYEFLGNLENTLEAFEKAIELNPKIGLKRKADALRKKILEKQQEGERR